MPVVHIPEPCPRTPGSMQNAAGGFYCDDCSKVVIDFRDKSNDEILGVFSGKGTTRICGVFNRSQASRGPKPTFELARFAAAVLLVFG